MRIVTRWIFRGGSRAGKNYSAEQWAAWVGEQRKSELLLFELGELEELLEEAATADNVQANDVASSKSAT